MSDDALTRPAASAAVHDSGWRLLLRSFVASVPVSGMARAVEVAAAATAACGSDADGHLTIDVRADRVEFVLHDRGPGRVTARDAELVAAITTAVHDLGLELRPVTGVARPVQRFEFCIDALDIPAIRPFWKAVLAYEDDPGDDGPEGALADPAGQWPSVWFQQMDEPRTQRNRIHFDLDVAHDEAPRRLQAAADAGGVLVSDDHAPAFWVIADPEGNEICICTWQGRD
jgi:4a-hydroxytetrahydrobiopterin dehydratase